MYYHTCGPWQMGYFCVKPDWLRTAPRFFLPPTILLLQKWDFQLSNMFCLITVIPMLYLLKPSFIIYVFFIKICQRSCSCQNFALNTLSNFQKKLCLSLFPVASITGEIQQQIIEFFTHQWNELFAESNPAYCSMTLSC